jgi:hypothetical protein
MNQSELTDLWISRPQNFGWFLGAGASRMSGLPTATDIIWDLKRRFYCREENQDVGRQDLQSRAVAARIQSFMNARGFPPLFADAEYTSYFEKIFGTDRERQRRYLRAMLSDDKVKLTVGNRIMGALIAGSFARITFTTNFDSVVEQAVADVSGRSLNAYHLEGSTAAGQALANEEYPIYCKLHGDFRYDSVKNLTEDLAKQDRALAECMLTAASRFGFIVAGYSGRDESVMGLFESALKRPNPFPHGLLWTGMRGAPVLPAVAQLIDAAAKAGVRAHYVEVDTYDALMLRLWRNLADRPPALDAKIRKTLPSRVSIAVPPPGTGAPLMRMNALPVLTLPTRAVVVRTSAEIDWPAVRDLQRDALSRILVTKGSGIFCWGRRDAIAKAFSGHSAIIGEIDLPVDMTGAEMLPIKGFMEEGIATAFARGRPLLVRRRGLSQVLIADAHADDQTPLDPLKSIVGRLTGQVPGLFAPMDEDHPAPEKIFWAEAVRISLARKGGNSWLVVDPDVWIWPPRARETAREFLDERRRDRLNSKFDRILTAWAKVLTGAVERGANVELTAFDGEDADANPKFVIGSRTGFSRRVVE